MAEPDNFVAVDWSGRRTGERNSIAMAIASADRLESVEVGFRRGDAIAHLIDLAGRNPRLAVGFDFSFSLPAWFLQERALKSAPQLWDLAALEGEQWLSSCDPPFWGRPGKRRPPESGGRAQMRATDIATAAEAGQAPRSPFQVSGAGSVGAATIRGIPWLATLRDAGFSIWPWDDADPPLAVEIWTRLAIGPLVKTNPSQRLAAVRSEGRIPVRLRESAARSEDSFDAVMSALWMSANSGRLIGRPRSRSRRDRLEGRTWRP